MSKECALLRCEARFQLKMYKTLTSSKWRCRQSARRCGAKRVSKPTCTKHTNLRPLQEVETSEKVRANLARSIFPIQTVRKNYRIIQFLDIRMLFVHGRRRGLCLVKAQQNVNFWAALSTATTTLHPTTPRYITLQLQQPQLQLQLQLQLHYTTLHYTALLKSHCATLPCTSARYTAPTPTTLIPSCY